MPEFVVEWFPPEFGKHGCFLSDRSCWRLLICSSQINVWNWFRLPSVTEAIWCSLMLQYCTSVLARHVTLSGAVTGCDAKVRLHKQLNKVLNHSVPEIIVIVSVVWKKILPRWGHTIPYVQHFLSVGKFLVISAFSRMCICFNDKEFRLNKNPINYVNFISVFLVS